MYVLERSGVTWEEKFYSRDNFKSDALGDIFSSLALAKKFRSRPIAEAARDRLDEEIGIYTSVVNIDIFGE